MDHIKAKQKYGLLASVVIILAVATVGFMLLRNTKAPSQNATNPIIKASGEYVGTSIKPLNQADHIIGNPNAPVVIIEYSDTECPFCKRFHETMHALIDNNDQVAWVYRHYPIASLHAKAFKESLASECAAEQGGNEVFWKYIDQVYARTNSNDSLDPEELNNIAEDLKLNLVLFKTCVETQKYADLINAQITEGGQNGIKGTPTSFVIKNGQLVQTIPGAADYNQMRNLIKNLLEN